MKFENINPSKFKELRLRQWSNMINGEGGCEGVGVERAECKFKQWKSELKIRLFLPFWDCHGDCRIWRTTRLASRSGSIGYRDQFKKVAIGRQGRDRRLQCSAVRVKYVFDIESYHRPGLCTCRCWATLRVFNRLISCHILFLQWVCQNRVRLL